MLHLEEDGDRYVLEYYGGDAGVIGGLLGIANSDAPA